MKALKICPEDTELFQFEADPVKQKFFFSHLDTFKRMWSEQGSTYWLRFLLSFRAYFTQYNQSKLEHISNPVCYHESERVLETGFIYIHKNFIESDHSTAKNLIDNMFTAAKKSHLIPEMLSSSIVHDPFYSKSSRDAFRALFGTPNPDKKNTVVMVFIIFPMYTRFCGAICTLLKRWASENDLVFKNEDDVDNKCVYWMPFQEWTEDNYVPTLFETYIGNYWKEKLPKMLLTCDIHNIFTTEGIHSCCHTKYNGEKINSKIINIKKPNPIKSFYKHKYDVVLCKSHPNCRLKIQHSIECNEPYFCTGSTECPLLCETLCKKKTKKKLRKEENFWKRFEALASKSKEKNKRNVSTAAESHENFISTFLPNENSDKQESVTFMQEIINHVENMQYPEISNAFRQQLNVVEVKERLRKKLNKRNKELFELDWNRIRTDSEAFKDQKYRLVLVERANKKFHKDVLSQIMYNKHNCNNDCFSDSCSSLESDARSDEILQVMNSVAVGTDDIAWGKVFVIEKKSTEIETSAKTITNSDNSDSKKENSTDLECTVGRVNSSHNEEEIKQCKDKHNTINQNENSEIKVNNDTSETSIKCQFNKIDSTSIEGNNDKKISEDNKNSSKSENDVSKKESLNSVDNIKQEALLDEKVKFDKTTEDGKNVVTKETVSNSKKKESKKKQKANKKKQLAAAKDLINESVWNEKQVLQIDSAAEVKISEENAIKEKRNEIKNDSSTSNVQPEKFEKNISQTTIDENCKGDNLEIKDSVSIVKPSVLIKSRKKSLTNSSGTKCKDINCIKITSYTTTIKHDSENINDLQMSVSSLKCSVKDIFNMLSEDKNCVIKQGDHFKDKIVDTIESASKQLCHLENTTTNNIKKYYSDAKLESTSPVKETVTKGLQDLETSIFEVKSYINKISEKLSTLKPDDAISSGALCDKEQVSESKENKILVPETSTSEREQHDNIWDINEDATIITAGLNANKTVSENLDIIESSVKENNGLGYDEFLLMLETGNMLVGATGENKMQPKNENMEKKVDDYQYKICAYCQKKETERKTFKKCSRCKRENFAQHRYYCSRDCQTEDWAETHREEHLKNADK